MIDTKKLKKDGFASAKIAGGVVLGGLSAKLSEELGASSMLTSGGMFLASMAGAQYAPEKYKPIVWGLIASSFIQLGVGATRHYAGSNPSVQKALEWMPQMTPMLSAGPSDNGVNGISYYSGMPTLNLPQNDDGSYGHRLTNQGGGRNNLV